MNKARCIDDMCNLLKQICKERSMKSCDSILDMLMLEFETHPPTNHELMKWEIWRQNSLTGTIEDYTATTILVAAMVAV
jgi:hypothetical protein